MGELTISLSRFDLKGFIGEIFDFLKQHEIIPGMAVCFTEDGDVTGSEIKQFREDSIEDLLFQGKTVFLPFSDINVGEPIPCADGGQYAICDPGNLDEEVAVSSGGIESVGFLIRVGHGMVVVCPAVFKGGDYEVVESMELEEDLKEFREPMDRFVNKFVEN